jgi:hypothetical protein
MSHSNSEYAPAPCGVARTSVQFSQAIKTAMDGPGGLMNVARAMLLMMVPVVGQMAVNGWCSEIGQRIVMGHSQPTPPFEFNDFGYWIKRGFPSFVTNLVWSVPMAILAQVAFLAIGSAITPANTEIQRAATMVGGFALFACVIGIDILRNSALTMAELTENTSAPFSLGWVLRYTRETLTLQLGTLLTFGMMAWAMFIAGMLACFTGLLFVIPVLTVAYPVLRAQMYQVNLGRGGSQLVIHPPSPCQTEQAQTAGY